MPRCVFLSHPQPRDSGDYLHRVIQPARALAQHWPVDDLQTSHPAFVEHAIAADVLVVLMVADPVVGEVMSRRKSLGRPTVYEISDDFHHFPPTVQGHAFYSNHDVQLGIEALARQADLLQFSSHGLADAYGHLNSRHLVLPNQLQSVPDLPPFPQADVLVRRAPVLGWAGSSGHLADAQRLAVWLTQWRRKRLACRKPADFTLKVMAAEPVVAAFARTGLRVRAHRPGSFDQYLAFLAELDIGFAVIGEDAFSAGRSDGKFIEMASRGVVCLASDLGEYRRSVEHGTTGFLFGSAQDFMAHLDALVDDPALRQEVRVRAHLYASQRRTHSSTVQQRLAAYSALFERKAASAGGGAGAEEAATGLRCMSEASELDLLEASMRQMNGRLVQALSLYMGLMQRAPDFYLPWQRAAAIAATLGSTRDAEVFAALAKSKLQAALARPPLAAKP